MANKTTLQDALRAKTREIIRGEPYQVATIPAAELPERAGALPEQLQAIARQYISARQRSGQALLDAARWIAEAREIAKHGEWQIFLDATKTSAAAAKRLLDTHATAMRDPQFAEAIRTDWISATVAGELAQPSLPDRKRAELLSRPNPPKREDVRAAARKSTTVVDLKPLEAADAGELAPAHWVGPTCRKLITTAELVRWASEQREQIGAEERAMLSEEAVKLIAELEAMIEALS